MFDSSLQPGAHVTANIRLVRLLGHGGMGSVWVADHLGLHTQVVVKFVSGDLANSAEIRERFEREAALAALAKSPNVVQVLDHGTTAFGVPYIAMELLEGEDLGKRIARARQIPPAIFSDWLTQACRGLGRAHSKGIIHRDIKPENIFLCGEDGETVVKILDFGIAKGVNAANLSGTKTGAFLGTAYYMSPESTMGAKGIDLRTDLWSMAVTAYLALTGVRPFDASSIGEIVFAITAGPIVPPSAHNHALSPAVDAWMAKALARPLHQRFSSAKEMADAFAAAIDPSLANHASPSEPRSDLPFAQFPSNTPMPQMPQRFSTSVGVVSDSSRNGFRDDPSTSTAPRAKSSHGLAIGAFLGCFVLLASVAGALAKFSHASFSHVAPVLSAADAAPSDVAPPVQIASAVLPSNPPPSADVQVAAVTATTTSKPAATIAPRPNKTTAASTSTTTDLEKAPVVATSHHVAAPVASTAPNHLKMSLE